MAEALLYNDLLAWMNPGTMDSTSVPSVDLVPVPLAVLAHAALWLRLEAASRHEREQRQHLEGAADNLQAAIDRWIDRRPVQGA